MMKKFLSMIIALCMLAMCGAAAAEDPDPLTAGELEAWANGLKAVALEEELLNDPSDEDSETEDGYLFQYTFAALYGDQTEMTADTKLLAAVIDDSGEEEIRESNAAEQVGPRGISLSMSPAEVIALFPNDNPEQAGDYTGAMLFLHETADGGAVYGRVDRDGQRVSAITYGEFVPENDGFRLATLQCLFTDSLLYEMRAECFDSEADIPLLTREDRDDMIASLKALDGKDEYVAVKTSRDGTELTEFSADDLSFSGLRFLEMTPEDLPGTPEEDMMEDDDGSYILMLDEADYDAVFRCDNEEGVNAKIVSFTIKGEGLEGPRGVRIGDKLHEDLQRFRFEGNESDGTEEILYGDENAASFGLAQYSADGESTLRYTTDAGDGTQAVLLLRYTMNLLEEITIYVQ
jgi:hypothetical protein